VIGGLLFLAGSVPAFVDSGWDPDLKAKFVNWVMTIGSAFFAVSSVFMILMWQCNDFGLTLLRQLNFAVQARGRCQVAPMPGGDGGRMGLRLQIPSDAQQHLAADGSGKPKFSMRGAFFIVTYCWFVFVALINTVIKQLRFNHATERDMMGRVTDLLMQVFIVLVLKLVLIVHSVVTSVPNEQPYRAAVIGGRFVFFAGAVVQTMQCGWFFWYPHFEV